MTTEPTDRPVVDTLRSICRALNEMRTEIREAVGTLTGSMDDVQSTARDMTSRMQVSEQTGAATLGLLSNLNRRGDDQARTMERWGLRMDRLDSCVEGLSRDLLAIRREIQDIALEQRRSR